MRKEGIFQSHHNKICVKGTSKEHNPQCHNSTLPTTLDK